MDMSKGGGESPEKGEAEGNGERKTQPPQRKSEL